MIEIVLNCSHRLGKAHQAKEHVTNVIKCKSGVPSAPCAERLVIFKLLYVDKKNAPYRASAAGF